MQSINLQENPLCLMDHNLIGKNEESIFYFSSYKGLSEWAKDRDKKPVIKKEEGKSIQRKVLELAEAERIAGGQDFKETEGANRGPQIKKYCNELLGIDDGIPWCCIFACWCIWKNGVNFIKTADTWALRDFAKAKGILFDTPEEGDIFLLLDENGNPTHTGFVVKIDPSDVRYILSREGNAGDSIKNCNDKLIKRCKFVRWWKL